MSSLSHVTVFAESNGALPPLYALDTVQLDIQDCISLSPTQEEAIPLTQREVSFWENIVENARKIHEEDEEEAVDGVQEKTQRHPPGLKQFSVLGGGIASVAALAMVFRNEPMITAGLSGTILDFIKQVYGKCKEGSQSQTAFRIIAILCGLTGISLFGASKFTGSQHVILQAANAAPFGDVPLSIFVKCDLPKLKPEKLLADNLKKVGIEISTKQAKVISTVAQGILTSGLMSQVFGSYIAGVGGSLTKAQMRKLVDMAWQGMEKINDPEQKKICFGIVYAIVMIGAASSFTALQFVENSLVKTALTVPAILFGDILARTIKRLIKVIGGQKEEEESPQTIAEKCKTVARVAGIVTTVAGVSYVVGTQMDSSNPAFVAALCQEFISFLKVGAKAILPQKIALPSSVGMVALLTVLYLALGDQQNKVWYGTELFATVFFITLSLYLTIPYMKGNEMTKEEMAAQQVDKKKKAAVTIEEIEEAPPIEEKKDLLSKESDLESVPAKKKKDKKEKKAKKIEQS